MTTAVVTLAAGLNAHDRCDSCGAQATSIAVKVQRQPLLFCGHHGRRHAEALAVQGWSVHHAESVNGHA